jgi:hypothetical protein
VLRVAPGSEEEFRCLREWLIASAVLDEAIARTEPDLEPPCRQLPRFLLANRQVRRAEGSSERRALFPVRADIS